MAYKNKNKNLKHSAELRWVKKLIQRSKNKYAGGMTEADYLLIVKQGGLLDLVSSGKHDGNKK